MTTRSYEIGLRGHDISRSRVVRYEGTLAGAKRRATTEFGEGFADHEIRIYDAVDDRLVSRRQIADSRWSDAA